MSRKKIIDRDYYIFAFNIKKMVDISGGMQPFAEKLGVTYDSVRRWCTGNYLPDGQTLLLIQEKCNISIDWLVSGKTGFKCPCCGDWSQEIRRACRDVEDILTSDDDTVKTALRSNIAAFKESIEKNRKSHHNGVGKKPGIWPGKDSAAKSSAG